jgi:hypothetical protein
MDPIDWWFLDSVCEVRQPLYLLTSEDLENFMSRPAHGLNEAQVVQTLQRLVAAGDLHAFNDERGEFKPTADEITLGVGGSLDASYGLTAQGGARWEEASKADWRRFMDEVYAPEDSTGEMKAPYGEHVGEITGSVREVVESYFGGVKFNGVIAREGSEVWDTFEPWQATYWKSLPTAHRVRFYCIYAPAVEKDAVPDWFRQIKLWYVMPGEQPPA